MTRQVSAADGRLARVYLTEIGRDRVSAVDTAWKRVEKEALAGLDDKDRKRLKRLLKAIEKNLLPGASADDGDEDLAEEPAAPLAVLPADPVPEEAVG